MILDDSQVGQLAACLIDDHRSQLKWLARGVLNNQISYDAEDIGHYAITETVLKARSGKLRILNDLPRTELNEESLALVSRRLRPFLQQIVLRQCYRANERDRVGRLGEELATIPAPPRDSPESAAQATETVVARNRLISEIYSKLPREDAQLLILVFLNEKKRKDVATILGISPSTLRSRLSRILGRLRQDPDLKKYYQSWQQDLMDCTLQREKKNEPYPR